MRVALADTFVPPYRIPLYLELANTPGWELKIFSSCETEDDRNWRIRRDFPFPHKFSYNLSLKKTVKHSIYNNLHDVKQVHFPLGLWWDLYGYNPDVVISAGTAARSLIASTYTFLTKKRLVVWAYSTLHTSMDVNYKERILGKILCKIPQAFIGMGSEARRYLESRGVSPKSIFDTGQAVDHERFKSIIDNDRRVTLRHKLGISGLCYLYVGSIIPMKGLYFLLSAWNLFCKDDKIKATLLLVGEGSQKKFLINLSKDLKLNNVKFFPFVQPENLPEIYQAADVFVFPTLHDTWAQVLGEAMASRLPILCSKYDGGANELIYNGHNGWIMDPLNVTDLTSKLRLAWDSRCKKESMGKFAQNSVANLTYSKMADGIRSAVDYAISK